MPNQKSADGGFNRLITFCSVGDPVKIGQIIAIAAMISSNTPPQNTDLFRIISAKVDGCCFSGSTSSTDIS